MKSKNIILLIIVAVLAVAKAATAQEYKISGEIKGLDINTGYVFIEDKNAPRGFKVDSVIFENGKFEYATTVKTPQVFRMSFRSDKLIKWVGHGYIPSKSSLLHFIAYPGANVKVKGEATDFCNAYPYGDTENETLSELHSALYPLINSMVNLIQKNEIDSTLTEEQKQANEKQAEEINNKLNQKRLDFLDENASSIAGLWLMEDMLIRSQIEIEKVAELIKKVDANKYKDLRYFKAVSQRVEGYKNTGIGMIAPEISGKNLLNDEHFELKSMKGKYVIIDFWGTWCHACLQGVPAMKKFRDTHSDKLQIVGLAKDRNEQEVKGCIKKHEMDWPNIMIGKGEQDYVARYNVQGFPTKILLDKNGKILLRSVGETEDFYTKVEAIINP